MQPRVRYLTTSLLLSALSAACTANKVDLSLGDAEDAGDATATTTDDTTGDPTEAPASTSTGDEPDDPGASGSGSSGSGEAPIACNPEDVQEPNENEDGAIVLPNITDEDGQGGRIASILAGEHDVDWFTYMGQDVAVAFVDPTGDLIADMQLRLCIFVECVHGPTIKPVCNQSVAAESPDNDLPGCCSQGADASVAVDLYCDADGDDSAQVFLRVDHGHPDICVPYEVGYHF